MTHPLRRKLAAAAVILFAMTIAYWIWPRRAHLRDFNPAAVARMEAASWRLYYEHRYVALFNTLYRLGREEYGFSPGDGMRMAYYAARAAAVFQPSRSHTEAEQAIPLLERYYNVVRRASGEPFDTAKAAKLELEWWQLRRELVPAERYGAVIAQVVAEIYGVPEANVLASAVLRAEQMRYRDARSMAKTINAGDWEHIEQELTKSYALLKSAVQSSPRKATD